ncbi:MAG: hypothetical protein K0R13_15 [Propionibacteriaceae bacterium]|jgi:hypothetical protein|nr:hypothetical protein [Propionibacteriaceae bacterium]
MAADGRGGARLSESPAVVNVDPGWLAARAAADTSARASTVETLLPDLINYLIEIRAVDGILEIIDLGAGTGANQKWLAPRLPFQQRWIHLDHDPVISRSLPQPGDTMIIDSSVESLGRLLAEGSVDHRLVTCSALLDVLTTAQLDAVCEAVIDHQVPALFSLSVTGAQSVSPVDPHDQRLLDAFNDHQRRAGRAGPEAITLAGTALSAGSYTVRSAETPWQLSTPGDSAFMAQLLQERLDAAVAQDPGLSVIAKAWFELRRAQLELGVLQIEVGHRDILALPGGTSAFAERAEVEHRADVTTQAEPLYGTGQRIREQIGAGEP